MEADFWRRKWKEHDIGFHGEKTNPFLVKYFEALSLNKGSRVFVPLCGKTRDIHWLLSGGYRVVGAELVEEAVKQLFSELDVEPVVDEIGKTKRYGAEHIDIFTGDIFELSGSELGHIDAVYDRAALVALPEEVRRRYTVHLAEITGAPSQLLITYQYDQQLAEGPPFSISDAELRENYGRNYEIHHLESRNVPGGLKGKCEATEQVWLLRKLS